MNSNQYIKIPSRAKDITGLRSGRLVTLGPVAQDRHGLLWKCRCDCGNESVVRAARLINGEIRSCGCMVGRAVTHGMTETSAYQTWHSMKDRCFNPGNASYAHYGARGIAVCDEWVDSFESFYAHVSQLPHYGEEDYSLDRIDNDGHYVPGNVRWATIIEQRRNQRRCRRITVGDVTLTSAEWAEISGINSRLICYRIDRGWTQYDAVFKPVRRQRQNFADLAAAME